MRSHPNEIGFVDVITAKCDRTEGLSDHSTNYFILTEAEVVRYWSRRVILCFMLRFPFQDIYSDEILYLPFFKVF